MFLSIGRARLLCGALLILVAWAVAAEPLPLPPLAPIEEGRYRARDLRTGATLWEEDWTLTQRLQAGQPVVSLEENGWGVRDGAVPTAWTLTMTIALWGSTPSLSSTRQVRDQSGHLQTTEERELDYAHRSGRLRTVEAPSGKAMSTTVRFAADAVTPELLPALLRLLPDSPAQTMRFELITREGSVVPMEARIVGEEEVAVPAGSYRCYRVELTPTGLIGFLAGLLLPKFLMWHTVVAPHFWVKYQGPADGLGSPEIVRELIRFDAHEGDPNATRS
jgi:hypothetical protein